MPYATTVADLKRTINRAYASLFCGVTQLHDQECLEKYCDAQHRVVLRASIGSRGGGACSGKSAASPSSLKAEDVDLQCSSAPAPDDTVDEAVASSGQSAEVTVSVEQSSQCSSPSAPADTVDATASSGLSVEVSALLERQV